MDNNKGINTKLLIAIVLIVLAAISRLFPHPSNFTPIAAVALFSGAYISKKYLRFLLPIAILFVSDLILNNFFLRSYFPNNEGIVWVSDYMLVVYGSMILIVGLAVLFLRKFNFLKLISVTLAGSLLFYLVTNAGSWLGDPIYTKNLSGLMQSYIAGIPFYKNALVGDLFYSLIIFGVYEFSLSRRISFSRLRTS